MEYVKCQIFDEEKKRKVERLIGENKDLKEIEKKKIWGNVVKDEREGKKVFKQNGRVFQKL